MCHSLFSSETKRGPSYIKKWQSEQMARPEGIRACTLTAGPFELEPSFFLYLKIMFRLGLPNLME